jgi:HlyD family secretion protein
VRPGDTIAQITPQQVPLVAKAKVANQDIDKVVVGQRVQLRVNACAYTEYGILKGKVLAVAADASASRNAEGGAGSASSDRTYEVLIKPDTTVLVNGPRQCRLQIGMDASASIISKEETFLQFVLRKARLTTNL